ncbi:MAG TPA: hypothetical protein PK079_01475 [Leptospiraceae bacterium]|nr:hypothetical protein [Leptospiraceae bacterium]HMW04816.1 hypothetical protein [Leptospiraceae bacterium]HMX34974.1 hypothetical protein [Leptospiraceae bacterium]HMY33516.1 hypothetical protein [Leptospiraceae bacterium]HMZ66103.1 hypothetical protein [Leptospiraceae bacterium]
MKQFIKSSLLILLTVFIAMLSKVDSSKSTFVGKNYSFSNSVSNVYTETLEEAFDSEENDLNLLDLSFLFSATTPFLISTVFLFSIFYTLRKPFLFRFSNIPPPSL